MVEKHRIFFSSGNKKKTTDLSYYYYYYYFDQLQAKSTHKTELLEVYKGRRAYNSKVNDEGEAFP